MIIHGLWSADDFCILVIFAYTEKIFYHNYFYFSDKAPNTHHNTISFIMSRVEYKVIQCVRRDNKYYLKIITSAHIVCVMYFYAWLEVILASGQKITCTQRNGKSWGNLLCCWIIVLSDGCWGLEGCIPGSKLSRLMFTLGSDQVEGRVLLTDFWTISVFWL